MKKTLLFLVALLSLQTFADCKPVALFGHSSDVSRMRKEVLQPAGIALETPNAWLKPEEMKKYSVIYFGEKRVAGADYSKAFTDYVSNGGIIIFTGGSPIGLTGKSRVLNQAAGFLGYNYHTNLSEVKIEKIDFKTTPTAKALGFSGKSFTWKNGISSCPDKIKNLETVAEVVSGKKRYPAVTVKKIGKGEIWWVAPMYFRFVSKQTNTGYADAEGRFILTESGKNIEALKNLYIAIFRRAKNLKILELPKSTWGTVPLAAPGNLKYDGTFKNKPTYEKPVKLANRFKLSENGKALAQIVVTHKEFRGRAAELKYHLDAITGAKFPLVYPKKRNAKMAAVIFEKGADPNTVSIKTTDNTVTLSGNTSLGMFYLLEKLGCRYLWPGKLGKVIPKQPTLWMPDIQMNKKPMLARRVIRNGGSGISERGFFGMKRCGVETEAEAKKLATLRAQASRDAKGNSSFFAWHGNGGSTPYGWGHAFGWLYGKYGKTNPEFFALQPDGSRSQEASPDRCRLCLSNRELIKVIAQDAIEKFKKNPARQAISVCLNDGGRARFCMCEECRKLDPPNAHPWKTSFNVKGIPTVVNYVQLTDRVLTFANRITEEINKVLPGKGVSIYIYSCYNTAPVAIKPHPNVVLISTTMNYTKDSARAQSLKTLASLASFGNVLIWRPNALRGFGNIAAPQNYARRMFEDAELLKFNNIIAMDFDCNYGFWGAKALTYYTLSKAMWNPDRLSYDDIVDDYCRSGFGDAAEYIKKYFTELENIYNRAAARECDYCDEFTVKKIEELEKILADAKDATGDAEIKARVQFLEYGLAVGKYSTRLYDAKKAKDMKTYKALQKEYKEYLRKLAVESPLSYSLTSLGFNTRFLYR